VKILRQLHHDIFEAKDNFIAAKVVQAFYANEYHSLDPGFAIGDCVWLNTANQQREYSSSKNCPNVLRFWTVLAVALWDHGLVLCNKYILYRSM
jgi:hypothetical protein